MSALLPAAFSAAYGDATDGHKGAFEDILIGAKNVVTMDRIGRERAFADKEVCPRAMRWRHVGTCVRLSVVRYRTVHRSVASSAAALYDYPA